LELGGKTISYVVRWDDGAAPNPFWGVCSLVVCKPRIRLAAQKGDWILGTGGKNSPLGDTRGRAIYAMHVTEDKLSMAEYDRFCRSKLPQKIAVWSSSDLRRKYGDSIYDFATNPPAIRPSCHDEGNRERDLRGGYALLSSEFYYFGNRAPALPARLLAVVKDGQNHQWKPNEPYKDEFVRWIRTHRQGVHGRPQMWGDPDIEHCRSCRRLDDREDLQRTGRRRLLSIDTGVG